MLCLILLLKKNSHSIMSTLIFPHPQTMSIVQDSVTFHHYNHTTHFMHGWNISIYTHLRRECVTRVKGHTGRGASTQPHQEIISTHMYYQWTTRRAYNELFFYIPLKPLILWAITGEGNLQFHSQTLWLPMTTPLPLFHPAELALISPNPAMLMTLRRGERSIFTSLFAKWKPEKAHLCGKSRQRWARHLV